LTLEGIVWAAIVAVVGGLCVLLTVLTLPGNWLLLAVAGVAQAWTMSGGGTPLYSWWTIAAAAVLALSGEALEAGMGAAGASAAGARRRGTWGAVIGSLAGAVVGTFVLAFIPLFGTLVGALVGAGLGAFVGELSYGDRGAASLVVPAAGAAAGRFAGLIVKSAVGAAMWTLLVVGALWP
jgi:hypothetical protein